MEWNAPLKPTEYVEKGLIEAILEGRFPAGSNLPAERELAAQLGVTRPTLREALQRLGRDGWLEIRQGKPTRVRDYWREGSLGVLGALGRYPLLLPSDFIANLLEVRLALAPAYASQAVEQSQAHTIALLAEAQELPEQATVFAGFDWRLHHTLTLLSGNPIFTLIINGFAELYMPLACRYFESPAARSASQRFYAALLAAARNGQAATAKAVTEQAMQESIQLFKE